MESRGLLLARASVSLERLALRGIRLVCSKHSFPIDSPSESSGASDQVTRSDPRPNAEYH